MCPDQELKQRPLSLRMTPKPLSHTSQGLQPLNLSQMLVFHSQMFWGLLFPALMSQHREPGLGWDPSLLRGDLRSQDLLPVILIATLWVWDQPILRLYPISLNVAFVYP